MNVAGGIGLVLAAFVAASAQDRPTFRAGTTLVELSVIAVDGGGRPVVDLKKEEIVVSEQGQPREVAFFRFEGKPETARPALEALPAGLFSNRAEYTAGPSRHVTAIVFDTINTSPVDQTTARAQVLKYLDSLGSGTRAAIYQLGWRLSVVHDFTDDLPSLRGHLARMPAAVPAHRPQGGGDAENVEGMSPEATSMLMRALAEMKRQEEQYRETATDRQRAATLAGLEELGRHLAGIPGRKSLVWISANFSTSSVNNRFLTLHDQQIRATMQRLATSGIAVYPVDALGLIPPASMTDAAGRGATRGGPPPRVQLGLPDQTHWATMDLMAAVTGGRVSRNSNDLADGVKLAERDSRAAYTIAFYAPGTRDDTWRRVDVRATRPDVHVATRQGYLAAAPASAAVDWPEDHWRWAVSGALASTVVHMDARVEPVDRQAHTYAVLLLLVPEDLHFRPAGAALAADIDIAVAQRRANGAVSFQKASTTLSIPAGTDMSGTVVRYRDRWTLEPETVVVRVIVRDRSTDRYGTLDLPVARMTSK